jgi:hypothetical protein
MLQHFMLTRTWRQTKTLTAADEERVEAAFQVRLAALGAWGIPNDGKNSWRT